LEKNQLFKPYAYNSSILSMHLEIELIDLFKFR